MARKAVGSSGGDDLRDLLEGVAEPLRRFADAAERSVGPVGGSPRGGTWADGVAYHIRRYAPLYAIATIWALIILLVPTLDDRDGEVADQAGGIAEPRSGAGAGGSGTGIGSFGSSDGGTDGPSAGVSSVGGGSGGRGTQASAGVSGGEDAADAGDGGGAGAAAVNGSGPYPWLSAGTTRGGFECDDGVRQLPWSDYAVPCREEFTGDNGGETYKGVTEDTITFVIRVSGDSGGPNSQTVDAFLDAAGQATTAEGVGMYQQYAEYFNEVFELYGREVVFERYESSSSNRTDEAQSKGREAACADATGIDEQGAFAVIAFTSATTETEPFSDCAAQRGLVIPRGASYFPEQWYAESWHPFVWNTVQECERIARDVAEYVGKRLWDRPAKWAGDHHTTVQMYTEQKRVLGTYVPDNDGYQRCVNIYEEAIARDYGAHTESRFNYQLDVSRFPDMASQAVIQFKADGVTTLVNACDPISTLLLTQNAKTNDWWPEWFLIGVANQDTPGWARDFDQDQVDGHMFGMSQVGDPVKMSSGEGEAAQTWKQFSDQWPPPDGFENLYFTVLHTFNMLQAAGPVLTPENMAQGTFALPKAGGADAAIGTWHFGSDPVYGADHTAIDDSREIYWVGNQEDPADGQQGTYVATYDGNRFETGEWSEEEPPIYPDGHP